MSHKCPTPDCLGLIVRIEIFDEESETPQDIFTNEIAETKQQKKAKNKNKHNYNTVLGKTKTYNKQNNSGNKKADDNKNKQKTNSDTIRSSSQEEKKENFDNISTVENRATNSSNNKNKTQSNAKLPLSEVDLFSSNFTVLKPNTDEPEVNSKKTNTKKKHKKQRADELQRLDLNIDDSNDDSSECNTRSHAGEDEEEEGEGEQGEEAEIDPRRPYYQPELLLTNPSRLKPFFVEKTNPIHDYTLNPCDSEEISKKTVDSLLDFMHDYLTGVGPMNINDKLLMNYIEDNFPPECFKYVYQDCGSLKKFLMKSVNFAFFDDFVCAKQHVVNSKNAMLSHVKANFENSSYMLR